MSDMMIFNSDFCQIIIIKLPKSIGYKTAHFWIIGAEDGGLVGGGGLMVGVGANKILV